MLADSPVALLAWISRTCSVPMTLRTELCVRNELEESYGLEAAERINCIC